MERAEAETNLKVPTTSGFYWCVNQFGIKEIVEIFEMKGSDKPLYVMGDIPCHVHEYSVRVWGPQIPDWTP